MPPHLEVVGLVAQDMAASLALYRRLGFTFADRAQSESLVSPIRWPSGSRTNATAPSA